MKSKYRWFTLFLVLSFLLGACTSKPTPAILSPVTVQLKYFHQAQFGGYYAADQNGYYAEEGLKVNFIEGGPTVDLEKAVLEGDAQFGVTAAELLIDARVDRKPLRAIAVIYRRSPVVFMTLADSGITRPKDFVGTTVQYNASTKLILNAMLAKAGLSPDVYQEVNVGSDFDLFYSGQVQVWNAFVTNEVLTAKAAGHDVNVIYPDDYGIHFYSDTLYTTDEMIASNPDLVLRFLRATLKGWLFAFENPEKIAPMITKYNPGADLEHETAQMIASLPLIYTGEDFIGWMKPDIWIEMEETLREQTALTMPLDITKVYSTEFLEEIYGETP